MAAFRGLYLLLLPFDKYPESIEIEAKKPAQMNSQQNPFTFLSPTRVTFGQGSVSGVADNLIEFGAQRPLIISDAVLVELGVLNPILEALQDAGLSQAPLFNDVPADSDLECVRKAVDLARSRACDSVIAVGGGSVIDTAKAVNIGLSTGGDIIDFEGINILTEALRPIVVIPTTAGTGSEVSAVAMIKDHSNNKKLLFGSRFLYSNAAVLDPSLLLSLPPRLTAATGLDAVTHAVESYVAMTSNPFSDALALKALFTLLNYLPTATRSGEDIEARSNTLMASTMAGMAFTNAGVGIVHALAHTIGAKYSVHHGVANAIFLPFGMKFNIEADASRYARAWSYLCNAFSDCSSANPQLSAKFVDGADENESAYQLVESINDLLDQCFLPKRLRDVGVPELSEEDLQELADTAMTDPAIMFNPREASPEDLITIIKGAY